jgi:peptidoglycan/xylan/chitin deacetylase (PgdA/CDA1 family)
MRFFLTGLLILLISYSTASADQANVFIYHRFNDDRHPSTNISTGDFRAQLELLQAQKIPVLRLGQVVESLRQGHRLPQPCAVITVDDAYRSFLTDGWPLVRQYGFPVTLFVSTATIGGADFLNWTELQQLQREGVEIGNHSDSHDFLLDRLPGETDTEWQARILLDIGSAQRELETHLGSAPQLFAYPYGEFDPELVNLVKLSGFVAAFGQQSGVMTLDQDYYRFPRFPVGGAHASLDEFRSKLFMKSLPVRVISPSTNVISENKPPTLRFYLNGNDINVDSLQCYVPGIAGCQVKIVNRAEGIYEVAASRPLIGRRSKYTVTASDFKGNSWYWYSQLWVHPQGRQMTDHSVPGRE